MKERVLIDGTAVEYTLLKQEGEKISLQLNGQTYSFTLKDFEKFLVMENGNQSTKIFYAKTRQDTLLLSLGTKVHTLEDTERGPGSFVNRSGEDEGKMVSPMPGRILKLYVKKGDKVAKDAPLVVMEAMKMEHTIKASFPGVVEELPFKEGDLVEENTPLIKLRKEKKE